MFETAPSQMSMAATRRKNLNRMFNPRSIAVIGASSDPSKAGSQALQALKGFAGGVFAVHPREASLQGIRCFSTISDLPEAVDLAIFAIPAAKCVEAAAEAASRGVGGVFIISGGFGESGSEGARLEEQLAEICQRTGLRILGPNTSGFINTHAPCVASFVPGVSKLSRGRVAVVAQSGGVNLSIAFQIEHLREGVSLAVGLGNAIDVTTADVLELLADDSNTAVIALHLEGVEDGRRLYERIRNVTPIKPVVAIVAGRADIGEFAVSHTGKLMGRRERTVAALEQAGAVVVNSTEDLAQAACILSYGRLGARPVTRIGLITGQAGPGLLIADGLKSAGLELPAFSEKTVAAIRDLLPPLTYLKNPVDTGRPGPTFASVVRSVAEDENVDAVLVFGLSEPAVLDPVAALHPAHIATGKPILFGALGMPDDLDQELAALRRSGLPTVVGPERLSLAAVVLDADARGRFRREDVSVDFAEPKLSLQPPFDEKQAKGLLAAYGIDVPASVMCSSVAEARDAFNRLRHPVVVKIAAHDVPHKTDVGGVILNVSDEKALMAALDKIARIPTSEPGKVLIEEMAPPGVEVIVGGVRDASWGPIVMIGLGGVMAEALADTAVRLAPISRSEASSMLEGLRAKALFSGFRNLPVCDKAGIIDAIIAVGQILCDYPELAEVEINPLRVNEKGAVALDALIIPQLRASAV